MRLNPRHLPGGKDPFQEVLYAARLQVVSGRRREQRPEAGPHACRERRRHGHADLRHHPLREARCGREALEILELAEEPIKAALLDQKIVAGLGNIYVSEALFRAGISPRRLAQSVAGRRAQRLAPAIRQVLEEAIAAGGSSLRDYVQASGELGYFQHAFNVYDREGEPCPRCGSLIRRIVQSGRASFYCGGCQR